MRCNQSKNKQNKTEQNQSNKVYIAKKSSIIVIAVIMMIMIIVRLHQLRAKYLVPDFA